MECCEEFCRLGCVCHSLSAGKPPRRHCGKPECMFRCRCTRRRRRKKFPHYLTSCKEPCDSVIMGARCRNLHMAYIEACASCYARLSGADWHSSYNAYCSFKCSHLQSAPENKEPVRCVMKLENSDKAYDNCQVQSTAQLRQLMEACKPCSVVVKKLALKESHLSGCTCPTVNSGNTKISHYCSVLLENVKLCQSSLTKGNCYVKLEKLNIPGKEPGTGKKLRNCYVTLRKLKTPDWPKH